MSNDLRRKLDSMLQSNETVLWEGMPEPGVHLSKEDAFLIPGSVFFFGFSVFWTALAASMGAPVFFYLWGSMFIIFGLYIMLGRFFHQAHKNRSTGYAVTNRRVFILQRHDVVTLPVNNLSLELHEHRSGLGTIFFETPLDIRRRGGFYNGFSPTHGRRCFLHIRNPHEIYKIIDSMRNV